MRQAYLLAQGHRTVSGSPSAFPKLLSMSDGHAGTWLLQKLRYKDFRFEAWPSYRVSSTQKLGETKEKEAGRWLSF